MLLRYSAKHYTIYIIIIVGYLSDILLAFGHLKQRKSFYPDYTLSEEYFVFEGRAISQKEANETFVADYPCSCKSFCSERYECLFVSIIYNENGTVECRVNYFNPLMTLLQKDDDSMTVFKRKDKFFPARDGHFYKFYKEGLPYTAAKSTCSDLSPMRNVRLAIAKDELKLRVLTEIVETYNIDGETMVDLSTQNGTIYWGDGSTFDENGIIRINIHSIPSAPIKTVLPGVFVVVQKPVGYSKTLLEYSRMDFAEKIPFICQANPAGL